jgi:hypothetical protein
LIYLDSPQKSLMIALDAVVAANQMDVTANFYDITPQSTTTLRRGGVQQAASNNTSDVTFASAPALQGIVRNVQTIFINNKDTATRTVTVKLDDNGSQKILVKQSIAAGESLVYEDNSGWQILSPITPPFVDTTPIVHGSSDTTKQLRIEVDGISSSTTRVWTALDADLTITGSAATMTTGRVVYTTIGGLLTSDANFLYDGTTVTISKALSVTPANANVTVSPTGTGTFTLNPATLGNIDNTRIGFTTRAAIQATSGDFSTTLAVTGHTTFEGVTSTGATGTGNLVYSASPTLTGTTTIATLALTTVGAHTISGAITYGGVTLNNAVTGTGNMVLSASPTLSGTVGGALTFSGALTLSSALTYGGVTLANAVTGTGNMMLSASPTTTGTLTGAAANFSGVVTVGTLQGGATAPQGAQTVLVSGIGGGINAFEWGHANTGGYRSHLGADSTGGNPWLGFNLEAGTTADTYRTRGFKGALLRSDMAGGFYFASVDTAAATDNQSASIQVRVIGTASATRYITLTGSNGGNPTIDVSAGGLTITPATTLSAALTYGGVTLSNSVTGTGSMVLSSTPTLTTPAFSGKPTGTVTADVYTPTLTSVTNIASSTAYSCQWMRIDNVVTVSGRFDYTATTGSIAAELGISLPVASNLANSNECGGTAITSTTWNAAANGSGNIQADAANDRATFKTQSANAGGATLWFSFTYRVI